MFFFFQAEDGIRDYKVTGVQTCALPISGPVGTEQPAGVIYGLLGPNGAGKTTTIRMIMDILQPDAGSIRLFGAPAGGRMRSEERRVGKECRSRGSPCH